MANVKLCFYGSDDSKTENKFIQGYVNSNKGLYLNITDQDYLPTDTINHNHVVLDKSTAVRLVKELKRQIALMD